MTDPQVGDALPTRDFGPMTTQMFVRYSGASGDLNPIHYDRDFAQSAGYPGVFSQGMHHAALLSTYVSDWSAPSKIRRFLVRFRDQVWPGDVLSCSGEVTSLTQRDDGLIASLSLTVTSQAGVVVMVGEADVLVDG
ncbi:MAG: MaoC/PaaZ C-terminal domain-containing protein [Rhodoglobus sp.]|nr:MaoC/PaaZ C-terminal domain-containing protein [Rhodoglobus sp.]